MSTHERKRRILVAEDSATQAHQLRAVLEEAGFDVVIARNGAAGLQEFDAGNIDLVLSDVVMPGISGYDLCRQIKSKARGAVPVILLTALEQPTDIIRGLACGADNFIRKPFDKAYLLERVNHVLETPRGWRKEPVEDHESISISFMGEELAVDCSRGQILEFLLSTFADFVRANEREKQIQAVEGRQRAELDQARVREEFVRKEKEHLDESRRFLQQTLDALTAQVAILDESGAIVAVNESWRRFARSNGVGDRHYEPGVEYLAARMQVENNSNRGNLELGRAIREVTTRQSPDASGEYLFESPSGTRWFRVHVSRFADSGPTRVVVAHEDISEQRATQELLRRQADELAHSNADLEKFAYVASHDLQEPLRVVAGYMQLFEQRFRDRLDAEAEGIITRVVGAVNRMKTLIEDLLEYSRVGTRGERFAPVDCGQAATEALENLRAAIEESQARIIIDSLPTVMADAAQIRQLFQNLLGNAIKYRGKEPLEIHVASRREGDAWRVSISDNGIGIDHQYWDRIFVIFQRLHTVREYPGTGIGLAICKRIVERHGGSLTVESAPGKGSTFHFTIPATQPQTKEVAHAERAA